jgi:phosphatidate cytidylyltransferase
MVSSVILIGFTILAVRLKPVLAAVVCILTALALYEFLTLIEKKGILIYKYFGLGFGILIPLSILYKFELTKTWELLFIVLALGMLFILQFARKENSGAIVGISSTLFGILYVSWFFSFVIKIRHLPNGQDLLFGLLLITKGGDIGAYVVGSRFGRHNLIPRISPKKTVEGALGGLGFSLLFGLISRIFLPNFSFPALILIGLTLGVLAQLGDLSESLIKRDCGIKDSGNIFPGLGGALDLIDSLLFTAPAFYFFMSAVLSQ